MKPQASILVVDDNRDLLNTFALILKRKGYAVDTAEDGVQALEKYQSRRFDVVLMDCLMPNMNGFEALHKMRENDSAARVILMTAYCEDDKLKKALDEGACGALGKPVNIARLIEMIGEVTRDPAILIVDDDDDFRFSMARLLEKEGYRVITAISGEDAVAMPTQQIDIAFVDIKMKVLDGLATSLQLKEKYPKLAIVMMTGYREEVKPIVDRARERGILSCLYKPFAMADLNRLVRGNAAVNSH
jgi:two-component system, NtrC family, response regulator HydG